MLILPVATFGLLWVTARDRGRRLGFESLNCRGALLLAYVAFEVLLLAITELTSIGHHFTAGAVESAWALAGLVLLVVSRAPILRFVRQLGSPEWRRSARSRAGEPGAEHWCWIAVLVAMGAVLVAVGGLYLPNNGDSMIYHLARVEHWVQDRTIAPFATHYTAQVELSPLSEYNLAHLHLLSGTDRFDAYVELLAAVVCVAGVSELARMLGGSRRTQLVAAVVCATIPTGVLLATSTENDYVAAATTLCLLVFAASFRVEGPWLARSIAVGAAAGLSYMAKGTTPSLMWPAAAALLALAVYRGRGSIRLDNVGRLAVTRVGAMAGAGLAVTVPFLYQNLELLGHFVGPTEKTTVIPTYDPAAMA
ncbi:MAG TPA: hypothetical protein VKW77_09565, partial [Acidimicrobiales bacterium]|nr:hypothetical protein [Acidimicrobiales bacterium]